MTMKKTKIILIACIVLIALAVVLALNCHQIKRGSNDDMILSCPRFAFKGQKVRFTTMTVCDADMDVVVSGADVKCVEEGSYEFIMPDTSVTVNVYVHPNGLA